MIVEFLDHLVLLGHLDYKVIQVAVVKPVAPVFLEQRENVVPLVFLADKELAVPKVPLVLPEKSDHLVDKVRLVHRDLWVKRAVLDLVVNLAQLVVTV